LPGDVGSLRIGSLYPCTVTITPKHWIETSVTGVVFFASWKSSSYAGAIDDGQGAMMFWFGAVGNASNSAANWAIVRWSVTANLNV